MSDGGSSGEKYRPSGAVAWQRFLPALIPAFLTAGLLAVALHYAYVRGFYYIVLTPALIGIPVACCVWFAVQTGKCRSRVTAVAASLGAAGVYYLGHYYVGMVDLFGAEFALRLDLLRDYVEFRMLTDALGEAEPDAGPKPFQGVVQWSFSCVELLTIVLMASFRSAVLAGRPYCEDCDAWFERQIVRFPPDSAPAMSQAIAAREWETIAQLNPRRQSTTGPHVVLGVERCRAADCPGGTVYISARVLPGDLNMDPFDYRAGTSIADSVPLSRDDLARLGGVLSESREPTATEEPRQDAHAEAAPPASVSRALESARTPSIREVLPPEVSGRILSLRHKIRAALVALTPIRDAILGIVLLAVGGALANQGHAVVGVGLLAASAVVLVPTLAGLNRRSNVRRDRYFEKIARREVQARGDFAVDPDDPKSLFAEIVPRSRWHQVALDTATDIGFLRIDASRGALLFEGDVHRWNVPASVILGAEVEELVVGQGALAPRYYPIVVEVEADHAPGGELDQFDKDDGLIEIPFILLTARSRDEWAGRQEDAAELASVLCALAERHRPMGPVETVPAADAESV